MAAGSERREIPMLIYAHFKFHASRMYTQESILQTISTPIPTIIKTERKYFFSYLKFL